MSILPATPIAFAGQLLNDIGVNELSLQSAQTALATGNAINQPSDNPPGAVETLQLQAAQARVSSYISSANIGLGALGSAQDALESALKTLNQAQDQLASASQAQDSPTAMAAAGTGLQALSSALMQIANTTYNGYAIFGGTSAASVAYDSSGNYQGNSEVASLTVAAGTQLSTGVTGDSVFGSGASSIFAVLGAAAGDLSSGNLAGAQAAETQVSAYITKANDAVATIGSLYDQFQQAGAAATSTSATLSTELGNVLGANIASVDTTYQQDQASLQAGLYAIANVLPKSLLSYLP